MTDDELMEVQLKYFTKEEIEDARAFARKQGSRTSVYQVIDRWGGYWETTINGKPYNFSRPSNERLKKKFERERERNPPRLRPGY